MILCKVYQFLFSLNILFIVCILDIEEVTRKDMALIAISMNLVIADKESVEIKILLHYNQATTKLAFHSNETSKDKLLMI